jgi:BatD DUF11 like domain
VKRDREFLFVSACVLGLYFCSSAYLTAQPALARAEITSKGDIWVGQRITLMVQLLVPGYFAGTPSFDLPSVPGMLLVPPSERPVLSSEQIEGASYTAQRHEFLVLARRPGDYEIPAFTIRLKYKHEPLDKVILSQTVQTTPVRFAAKAPPGAEKLAGIISARDLKVVETWHPQPGHAKAGDAFTRTIIFSASDVPAMAFPPFPTPEVDGLGIYRKDPEVLDHSERGVLLGERRETITYVCERPGHFVVPAARLTWWNLDAKELRTIDFPACVLDVAANPAVPAAVSAVDQSRPSSAQSQQIALLISLVLIVITILLWKMRPLWQPAMAAFRPRHLVPLNPTHERSGKGPTTDQVTPGGRASPRAASRSAT